MSELGAMRFPDATSAECATPRGSSDYWAAWLVTCGNSHDLASHRSYSIDEFFNTSERRATATAHSTTTPADWPVSLAHKRNSSIMRMASVGEHRMWQRDPSYRQSRSLIQGEVTPELTDALASRLIARAASAGNVTWRSDIVLDWLICSLPNTAL